MGFPNNNCGECIYWLAFMEPETSEKGNEEILLHCALCAQACGIVDEEYFKIVDADRLQTQFRKSFFGDI